MASRAHEHRTRLHRWRWTLVAVLPIVATLSGALVLGMRSGKEIACWMLPNAYVLAAPKDGCPLRSLERVRRLESPAGESVPITSQQEMHEAIDGTAAAIRVAVLRDGEERWIEVPITNATWSRRALRLATALFVAGALMWMPLFLLWRSTSAASVPFALFYSATSVVAITFIAGRASGWLTRGSLLAMISAPAVLAHLSFTFPREREVIREAPTLVVVPYALSAVLIPIGWFALDRSTLLWPTFMYLLLALVAGAWTILVASCAFAIKESKSPIERERARILCFGSALLPLVPIVMWSRESAGAAGTIASYLWTAAVVLPLPIGLAISRYNLFDLELDVRHWVGRLAYLGVAAFVVTLILEGALLVAGSSRPLRDPWLRFVVAFGCVLALEPLRGRMLGLLESMLSPRRNRMRALREGYEARMSLLHEDDEVARELGEVLRAALAPRGACVFLPVRGGWRPAYPFGPGAPTRTALIPFAITVLGERSPVHLPLLEEGELGAPSELLDAGVEIVASVDSGGERFGVVLISSPGRAAHYTGMDLDFVAMACSHAGIALRNARITEEMLAAERHATTGRIALGLAHDVGKELDWMSRLARRLPTRVDDRQRLLRDVSMIQDFTEGLVSRIRDFVRDATEDGGEGQGVARFEDLIDQAIRRVTRIHGCDRVTQSLDPSLRSRRVHENLGRAVFNLLDNALHATPENDPVHLFATLEDGWIRIEVLDRGRGIPQATLHEAFKPGFSTRQAEGGLGVGLPVAREIAEALGGTIALGANPGGGTRATLRVPAEAA